MATKPVFDYTDRIEFPPLPSFLIPYPKQQYRTHADKRDNNNYNLGSRMDELNDTLIELIFKRLVQWRHLVTCKCVSKRWNSIISNPYFSQYIPNKYFASTLYLGLKDEVWFSRSENYCLITEHPYFQRWTDNPHDIIPYNIVANHDDIFVLNYGPVPHGVQLSYKIANPLTKQFIVVPMTSDEPQYRGTYYYNSVDCEVGLAGFVNGVSTIDVPNSNTKVMGFRIIRIFPKCWQIYSSETRKWKTYRVNNLDFVFKSQNTYCRRDQALTLNNRIHWRGRSNKILVIDPFIDDNVPYCVLILPREIHEKSVLGSCRNRLRIAQFESNKFGPSIKVWDFDDYADDLITTPVGNTKAKLRLVINFTLKLFDPIKGLFSIHSRCNIEVICCHPDDPEIIYIIFDNKLLECDAVNRRCRVIRHCTSTTTSIYNYMLVHPLTAPDL